MLDGRTQSVGTALAEERGHLLPRVAEGFDLTGVVFPLDRLWLPAAKLPKRGLLDKQGCVTVKANFYKCGKKCGKPN